MKRLKLTRRGLALLALAPSLAAVAQQPAPRIDQLVQDLGEDRIDIRRYTVEVVVFRYAENVSVGNEVFVPDPPPVIEETVSGEAPFSGEGLSDDAAADDGQALGSGGGQALTHTDSAADDRLGDGLGDGQALTVGGQALANVGSVATDAGDATSVENEAEQHAEDAEPPLQSGKPVVEYLLLTEDELTMGDVIAKFELLDAYDTLMHFGWTQTVFPEMEPKLIEIDSLAEPPPGLDGSFTLYLSRYLHLNVDLALEKPPAFDDPVAIEDPVRSFSDARMGYDLFSTATTGKVRYRIQEDRIFKSGDLRYFDHPKFGVVVKVSRVEETEPDESADDLLLPAQPVIE